jgi:cysteine desulfurase
LLGVALAHLATDKKHILLSAIEHHAVLEVAPTLRELGFEVEIVPCNARGVVEPHSVRALLRPQTCLVSVMAVNNEVGTIQPIEDIAREIRSFEAEAKTRVILHTDAVQAPGKIAVSLHEWDADLASLSAHKIGGPKGAGALWIRRGEAGRETPMRALLRGGGQERGRRAGTENVPAIVGFGAAAEHARKSLHESSKYLLGLRQVLEARIQAWPGARIHGEVEDVELEGAPKGSLRAPHVVSFSLRGARAESVALRLDMAGFAVGTGSACASGAIEPSHVLQAMGVGPEEARSSLRVSLGTSNTRQEVVALADEIEKMVSSLN